MTSRPGVRARSGLVLLGLVVFADRPVHAQPAPTEAETATLSGQVMPMLRPELRAVLDKDAATRPVPWSDEASGLSGTVAAAPGTGSGGRCRAIRVTVRDGARELALERAQPSLDRTD